uniref:Uncharacterized protein n=1 Tax=Arundo donax TaxID=35708 RepID=A0A0A9GQ09_ARUDO
MLKVLQIRCPGLLGVRCCSSANRGGIDLDCLIR